jgi:CRISPR system Cascade subunit CasB
MSKIRELDDHFVGHLERLYQVDDRAALARLRRGLGKEPGMVAEMHSLVLPWLPAQMSSRQENAFYLVASLFASHPEPGGSGSLGRAFRRLATERESSSIEQRFVALLNCHEEDLPEHLRHAISLLAAGAIAVDWRQLLADMQWWGHADRFVQREWARDFWGGNGPAKS